MEPDSRSRSAAAVSTLMGKESGLLFGHTVQLSGLLKADGTLIDANHSALVLAGITLSEVRGRPFWETPWWCHSEQMQTQLKDGILRAAGGEFVHFVAAHPAADGTVHTVDFSITPIRNDAEEVVYLVAEGQDISHQIRAERLNTILHDLSISLAAVSTFDDALELVLRSACKLEGVDCGGIYAIEPSGKASLAAHYGLSDRFVAGATALLPLLSQPVQCVLREAENLEGLRSRTTVPVRHHDEITAVLYLASRTLDSLLPSTIAALEAIAAQLGAIFARIRAEMATHESEETSRTLVNSIPAIAILVDEHGTILHGNPALAQALGCEMHALVGRSLTELALVWLAEVGRSWIKEVLGTGLPLRREVKHGELDFDIHVHPVAAKDRQAAKLTIVAFDITELKRNEEALRSSKAQLEEAQRVAHCGSWEFNVETRVVQCSSEALRLFGLSAEQACSNYEHLLRVTPPDERQRVEQICRQAIVEKRRLVFEHCVVLPDGSTRYVEEHLEPQVDLAGRLTGVLGSTLDITERKTVEAALRRSEAQFSLAFHASPVAMAILSRDDGRYVEVNRTFERQSGYSRDEAIGKRPSELHIWTTEEGELLLKRIAEEGSVRNLELHTQDRAGTQRVGQLSVDAIDIDGRPHLLATLVDMTELKQADELRALLEARLYQSQRMEAVGRLAGGVAHDFNNMLTVILGNTELLRGRIEPEDPSFPYLVDIQKAGIRSQNIVRQLLALSRKQVFRQRILTVNDSLTDLRSTLARLVGEDISLQLQLSADLWPTKCDPSQLDQVIINLVANARDAMPKGGQVRIETSNIGSTEYSLAHPNETRSGDFVVLTVTDNGTGMDPETARHVFEPFFTTKKEGRGTGLGLATVYGIIDQHGGTIEVQSNLGVGTTFRVFLPRCLERQSTSPTLVVNPSPSAPATVLIVEDEDMVRAMLVTMLRSLKHEAIAASSPEQALALCRLRKTRIDILLTDIIMPEMNGCELAEELLTLMPDMRVLFMSGHSSSTISLRGILPEDTPFLQKPFNVAELQRMIEQVQAGALGLGKQTVSATTQRTK